MSLYSLIKKPFFSQFQRPWSWPDGVDRADWTRVEFDNAGGTTLVGLHGASTTDEVRATLVFPHPMAPEAKAWGILSGHTSRLRDAGFDVLLFDFNGFGESEDGTFDFPGDVLAAGRFAAERSPDTPVGLFGISMGAGYGICAMDVPGHPFRAGVIESAFTSLDEYWKHFKAAYLVLRTISLLLPATARRLKPIERIPTIDGVHSLFFISGERDRAMPPHMGDRLMNASPLPPSERSMWVVPEGKHLRNHTIEPEAYWARVMAYLDDAFPA